MQALKNLSLLEGKVEAIVFLASGFSTKYSQDSLVLSTAVIPTLSNCHSLSFESGAQLPIFWGEDSISLSAKSLQVLGIDFFSIALCSKWFCLPQ